MSTNHAQGTSEPQVSETVFTVMQPSQVFAGARSDDDVISRLESLSLIGGYHYGRDIGTPGALRVQLLSDAAGHLMCNNSGSLVRGPSVQEAATAIAYFSRREVFVPELNAVVQPDGTAAAEATQGLNYHMWTVLLSLSQEDDWMKLHDFAESLDASLQWGHTEGWTVLSFPYGEPSDVSLFNMIDRSRIWFQVSRRGTSYWIGSMIGERKHRGPLQLRMEPPAIALELTNAGFNSVAEQMREIILQPHAPVFPGEDFFHLDFEAQVRHALEHHQGGEQLSKVFAALNLPISVAQMLINAAPLESWSTLPDATTVRSSRQRQQQLKQKRKRWSKNRDGQAY